TARRAEDECVATQREQRDGEQGDHRGWIVIAVVVLHQNDDHRSQDQACAQPGKRAEGRGSVQETPFELLAQFVHSGHCSSKWIESASFGRVILGARRARPAAAESYYAFLTAMGVYFTWRHSIGTFG